jgi:hypothetical protein
MEVNEPDQGRATGNDQIRIGSRRSFYPRPSCSRSSLGYREPSLGSQDVSIRRSGRECLVSFVGGELNPSSVLKPCASWCAVRAGKLAATHATIRSFEVGGTTLELSIRTLPMQSQLHSVQRMRGQTITDHIKLVMAISTDFTPTLALAGF